MRLWPQGVFVRRRLERLAASMNISVKFRKLDTGTSSVGTIKVLEGPVYDMRLLWEAYMEGGGEPSKVKLLYEEGFEMEYWRAADAERGFTPPP